MGFPYVSTFSTDSCQSLHIYIFKRSELSFLSHGPKEFRLGYSSPLSYLLQTLSRDFLSLALVSEAGVTFYHCCVNVPLHVLLIAFLFFLQIAY